MVDLLIFTSNTKILSKIWSKKKKILSKIVVLDYIKINSQTLSLKKMNEFFIINNLIIINLQ